MSYIKRSLETKLNDIIKKGKSVLLLGPRQTGKTTLLKHVSCHLTISFINPKDRLRYEIDPSILVDEVKAVAEKTTGKPLIVVDEVQKVPKIMDVVQYLIDDKIAQFILTGSSARKLKRQDNINLLPGRVIPLTMDALSIDELPEKCKVLEDLLLNGSLPEIVTTINKSDKEDLLNSYVTIYLQEEIRMEAVVRNLGNFSRFLELAASESGMIVNYSKLSQIIGVAHTTVSEYYQILEDCLIAQRIDPLLKSKTRHKLSKSSKYLFFDLGLRRLAAKEGNNLPSKIMGQLFEQFIGLELIKFSHLSKKPITLLYWRDLDGPEVDWVLQTENKLIPIEVKLSDKPRINDAKHLNVFLNEYQNATRGYVICQAPRKMKLAENLYALPWQSLFEIFE